ncbi:MAG: hypothetical protein Q8M08_04685 [Bacteroidales bacterium]|nr:hypothetical protein [Bacteroidales bacterium]
MKNLIRPIAILFLLNLILSGCYYDKESELYPQKPVCDTAGTMTYSQSIIPVVTANCNVCHSTAVASGGVITDNYNDLSVVANDGRLWAAVNWTGPVRMPQGLDKLSDCNLTKIKKWVDAGVPNN